MKIEISGHQISIDSLRGYINQKLKVVIEKFFNNAISAQVVLGLDGDQYSAEIIIDEGIKNHNHATFAASNESEARSAFDSALRKMKSQLSKHKDKLHDKHRMRTFIAKQDAKET